MDSLWFVVPDAINLKGIWRGFFKYKQTNKNKTKNPFKRSLFSVLLLNFSVSDTCGRVLQGCITIGQLLLGRIGQWFEVEQVVWLKLPPPPTTNLFRFWKLALLIEETEKLWTETETLRKIKKVDRKREMPISDRQCWGVTQ